MYAHVKSIMSSRGDDAVMVTAKMIPGLGVCSLSEKDIIEGKHVIKLMIGLLEI